MVSHQKNLNKRCSCEQCQLDLAVFIESEILNPIQVAHTMPHVWRHLRSCRLCFQVYRATYRLLAAEATGALTMPFNTTASANNTRHTRILLTQQLSKLISPQHGFSLAEAYNSNPRNIPHA